jgi:uncharacterized membrane protein YbhN (UPF0104 family)
MNISFEHAFALEVVLGFVRSLAFISPGGIGVQDAGYALLLASLDPASATKTAAFVVLKRCKELAWCAVAGLWYVHSRTSAASPRQFAAHAP